MKVEVVGKKSGEFTDKNGKLVSFGKLHCVGNFDISERGTKGKSCLILSCPPENLEGIPVPCTADIQFNQFGRLAGVDILDASEESEV